MEHHMEEAAAEELVMRLYAKLKPLALNGFVEVDEEVGNRDEEEWVACVCLQRPDAEDDDAHYVFWGVKAPLVGGCQTYAPCFWCSTSANYYGEQRREVWFPVTWEPTADQVRFLTDAAFSYHDAEHLRALREETHREIRSASLLPMEVVNGVTPGMFRLAVIASDDMYWHGVIDVLGAMHDAQEDVSEGSDSQP